MLLLLLLSRCAPRRWSRACCRCRWAATPCTTCCPHTKWAGRTHACMPGMRQGRMHARRAARLLAHSVRLLLPGRADVCGAGPARLAEEPAGRRRRPAAAYAQLPHCRREHVPVWRHAQPHPVGGQPGARQQGCCLVCLAHPHAASCTSLHICVAKLATHKRLSQTPPIASARHCCTAGPAARLFTRSTAACHAS